MYQFYSGACASWTDTNFTTERDGKGRYAFSIAFYGDGPSLDVDSRPLRDHVIQRGIAPMFVRRGEYPKHSAIHNRTGELVMRCKYAGPPPLPGERGRYPAPVYSGSASGYAAGTNIFNTFRWGRETLEDGYFAQVVYRQDSARYRQVLVLTIDKGEVRHLWEHNWSGIWPDSKALLRRLRDGEGSPLDCWYGPAWGHPSSNEIADLDYQAGVYLGNAQTAIFNALAIDESDRFDKALESVTGPNMSWLETLIPIKDLPSSLKSLAQVPRTLKDLASLFLGWKYGILTMPGDIKNVLSTIQHLFAYFAGQYDHMLHAHTRSVVERQSWTCECTESALAAIANQTGFALALAGIDDIATEIWNCIPYSFVVDWVLGIGDTISRVENEARWKTLHLQEISYSYKCSCEGSLLGDYFPDNWSFEGRYTVYKRQYLTELPPVNYFQLPDIPDNIRRHWVEGTALLVQQLS